MKTGSSVSALDSPRFSQLLHYAVSAMAVVMSAPMVSIHVLLSDTFPDCVVAFCNEARKPRPSLAHYPCSQRSNLQLYIYGLRSSLAFQGGSLSRSKGVFVTFPVAKLMGLFLTRLAKGMVYRLLAVAWCRWLFYLSGEVFHYVIDLR